MENLRAAQRAVGDAKRRLQNAVIEARSQGSTWQQIGDALDMSRQAAFKRFGRPIDPTTGDTIEPRSAGEVAHITENAFRRIADGDHEAVHGLMTDETARALTSEVIADTWRRTLAEVGELEGFGTTHIELDDGTRLGADESVFEMVVGATTLHCEGGEVVGRVAFDHGLKIIGILIVPVDHGDLAF